MEQKNSDNCDNPDAPANGTSDKTENTPFKKPILVGKIGHFPKKIKNLPAKPTEMKIEPELTVTETSSAPNIEQNNDTNVKIRPASQYVEPDWGGKPDKEYNFEVLKEGRIIENINLKDKTYWMFGRLSNCDISMQHPTVSRHHVVLQYRAESDEKHKAGFYLYDLGSTHGTFLNKNRLRPRIYVRMQVGHILKLGCSTRSYLLNGPEEDAEEESEFTVTELKQQRKENLERLENERKAEELRLKTEREEREKREEERGVDWGMGEDADEETDLSENPYAQSVNEELYLDDPKKTLRGFFEREGLELVYDCSEQGMGQFMCRVQLPIDDERGRSIHAEVIHKGKKKDAVIQCALEACRLLDRHGLLRQATHESRKRKVKDWAENDYYDSDDDTFLDRTGAIEKKREKRMNAKKPQKAETYESLLEKERKLNDSIKSVQNQLNEAQEKINKANNSNSEEDSLDAYMKELKDSKPDKSTIIKLKNELAKLKQEHEKVIKLVNIVRPANLPPLVPQYSNAKENNANKSKVLPIFGKRKKVAVVIQNQNSSNSELVQNDDIEEDDEEHSVMETENSESENGKIVNVDEKNDSNNLEQSSLDSCEGAFKKISDKLHCVVRNISSDKHDASKNQKLQSLFQFVTEETNKIEDYINNFDIPRESETKEVKMNVEAADTNSPTEEVPKVDVDINDQVSKKKKNQRRIQQRQEKVEIEKQKGYKEDAQKEDYNMWLPPKDQTGDGRTKLNERFGY